MDVEIAAAVAQFGAAGLIGSMWLLERRSAGQRERDLSKAHDRIVESKHGLDVLVSVIDANTRAMTSLERGQMELVHTLNRQRNVQCCNGGGAGAASG